MKSPDSSLFAKETMREVKLNINHGLSMFATLGHSVAIALLNGRQIVVPAVIALALLAWLLADGT